MTEEKFEELFKKFYDDDLKDYYLELQHLLLQGKTLTYDDISEFWRIFKHAQKHAFKEGMNNAKD